MPESLSRRAALSVALLWAAPVAWPHADKHHARLPVVGPAPAFTLTAATGEPLALADLRGKVLALTFIFTTCTDSCPLLTAKMAEIQRRLGSDFGTRIHFVSITVDPQNDTPERLRRYAEQFAANVATPALCVERPVFTRIASASRMRSMSVVTESVPRSFAISATVLPAYAGFGS